jgi:hypothetical protein
MHVKPTHGVKYVCNDAGMTESEEAVQILLNANVEDGYMSGFVYNIEVAHRAFNHFDKVKNQSSVMIIFKRSKSYRDEAYEPAQDKSNDLKDAEVLKLANVRTVFIEPEYHT